MDIRNSNGFNGNGFGSNGHNGHYGAVRHSNGAPSVAAPAQDARSPRRFYDADFVVTEAYRASLPDLQNGPASLIEGSAARTASNACFGRRSAVSRPLCVPATS